MMKRIVALVGVLLIALPAIAADRADKREIIKQARAAYYSLREKGLDTFSANAAVNWEVVLGPIKTGDDVAQRAAAIKLLNGLHFGVAMDSSGKVSVTHRADTPAPNETSQKGYDQIFTGMEQVITGFYDTYSPFMITSPFPAVDGDYTVEDIDIGYRVTYKEGASSVLTRMTKTFAIIDTTVNAADFDSVIKPAFSTTEQGYVMSGYNGYYKPKTGPGTTLLDGTLEQQMVDGLRMMKKLHFDSSVDGVKNQTEVVFTDYIIKKK
jgi:hypothetical protein